MKRKLQLFNKLLCLLLLSVGFAACSNNSDEEEDSSIVGTWYSEKAYYPNTPNEYKEYAEISYSKDGSVTGYWKETYINGHTEEEFDHGRYETHGSTLIIWWDSEAEENASDGPWTVTFTINGNKMSTTEGGRTVWIRKN